MKYIITLLAPLIFPSIAFGAWSYDLLAPFSGPTTITSLGDYLNLIFLVAVGTTGILAVLMIVICGIKLMGSPSPSAKSEAKKCILNAIIGVMIAISSWILLNTINPLFLSTSDTLGNVNTGVVTSPSSAIPTTGTYTWEVGPLCPSITGKIASVVSPSYCTSPQPPGTTICCGYVDSPITPPTAGPLVVPPPIPAVVVPPTTVNLSKAVYSVNENGGSLTITINRSAGTGAGTVDYKIVQMSAHNGSDYIGVGGTIAFAVGETVKTVAIPIINDAVHEKTENFNITLTNPTSDIGLGLMISALLTIKDDDLAPAVPPVDFIPPTLTIARPTDGFATTSNKIMLTFTTADNVGLDSVVIIYTPAPADVFDPITGMFISVSTPVTTTYCGPGGCPLDPLTYNQLFTIDTTTYGVHTISISACDRQSCTHRETTIYVQRPCVSNAFLTCKILPPGKSVITNPSCGTPPAYVFPPNNAGLTVPWTSPYANGANYPPTSNGFVGVTVGLNTDSYAFQITNPVTGGGEIIVMGGAQPEYPIPNRVFQGKCPDATKPYCEPLPGNPDFASPDCIACRQLIQDEINGTVTGYTWSGGAVFTLWGYISWADWLFSGFGWGPVICPDNIVPNNIIVSISDEPGDLSSDSNTVSVKGRAVSGYCGNADTLGLGSSEVRIKISANPADIGKPGVCSVQTDRKYYVNISTALPGNHAINKVTGADITGLPANDKYSILWNWLPN